MSILDANIVLISLPTIIRKLPGTTTFDGIWIIMGYTLITATILLTIGRLGDLFGRAKLYNTGFAIFTIGSGLCSLSPDGLSLVFFRLVQGLGAALIWSNNAAILTDAFPATERGRALGINQVAGVTGSVLGLVAGGVLTGLFGWQSIFWINIPPGIFATVWAYLRLRDLNPRLKGERLDPLGNVLFGLGLTMFLVGLTLGAIEGEATSDLLLMAGGLAMLGVFALVEARVKSPMMDVTLFRIRAFAAARSANLLASTARSSVSLVLVFYFQGVLLYGPLTAGLLLLPFSLSFVCLGPLSGHLSDRFGTRRFAAGGMVVSAVALIWFATIQVGVPYTTLVFPMVLAGAGGGMFVAPNVAAIMNSVSPARRGVASAISSTLFSVGSLLSLGIVFAVLGANVPVTSLQAIFAGLPPPTGTLDVRFFVTGMREAFVILAAVSLIGIVPSLRTGTRKPKETIIYGKPHAA